MDKRDEDDWDKYFFTSVVVSVCVCCPYFFIFCFCFYFLKSFVFKKFSLYEVN